MFNKVNTVHPYCSILMLQQRICRTLNFRHRRPKALPPLKIQIYMLKVLVIPKLAFSAVAQVKASSDKLLTTVRDTETASEPSSSNT
jgi:hypothetical protein